MIVAAAAQPQVRISFVYQGETCRAVVPPTYSYDTDEKTRSLLSSILKPQGYRVADARVPPKLLAVRSGLAGYGKNNLTCIDGLGSFFRLKAFFSDLPCSGDAWGDLQVLEDCHGCPACRKSCPTHAISANRFLIQAERCLTFHNERQAEFPALD